MSEQEKQQRQEVPYAVVKASAARSAILRGSAELLTWRARVVEIALHEVVKSTGEVKDVFKFTYGGRYYNRLSLSEKIRAGLEVSELVKRLTGRNYPVFIDNMESVDELTNVRPTGQIIMAKCVRGAALTVKPMGRPQIQRAA